MSSTVLDAKALEQIISAAVAAPSIHNTQPWRYRLIPDTATLEVRSTPQPGLLMIDPAGRAVHISVGAALFNLRLAVRHLGWEPVVRLLPRPTETDLLATVRLDEPPHGRPSDDPGLFDAIWQRHSSRQPFSDEPVPAALLAGLGEAARAEGAVLRLPDVAETARLFALTAEAEQRNTTDPRHQAETRGWLRDPHSPASRTGVPTTALGPQDSQGRLPVRDFGETWPAEPRPPVEFEYRPRIAVLSTVLDEPADWLRTGQALERILLLITKYGAKASLLHQAMEWHDLRWAMRDPQHGAEHVQMLIRFGYGPDGAPTPRMPATAVTEHAEPE